jgi:hypothetical protein
MTKQYIAQNTQHNRMPKKKVIDKTEEPVSPIIKWMQDPYPKIAEQDHKPTMTVYCRVVFSDTGTVKDLTPAYLYPNDTYQINYTRDINGRDFEPREGIKYIGYLQS